MIKISIIPGGIYIYFMQISAFHLFCRKSYKKKLNIPEGINGYFYNRKLLVLIEMFVLANIDRQTGKCIEIGDPKNSQKSIEEQ